MSVIEVVLAEQERANLLVVAFQGLPNASAERILEQTIDLVPVASVDEPEIGREVLVVPDMFVDIDGDFFHDDEADDANSEPLAFDRLRPTEEIVELANKVRPGVSKILKAEKLPFFIYPQLELISGEAPIFDRERTRPNRPFENLINWALASLDPEPETADDPSLAAW